MDPSTFTQEEAKELLDAHAHIWSQIFYFLNSMALKCAIQLGIPDAIHNHGEPITLGQLATLLPIHPTKITSLYRLMRLLVSSKFFSKKTLPNGEEVFALTLNSKLLLKDHPLTQAPFALAILDPALTNPSHNLSRWFQNEAKSPFEIAHRRSFWEYAQHMPKFNEYFNQAMESDSRFVTSLLMTNDRFKGLFEGLESLVDVGGGNGTTAEAISEAYPWLKCSVLELPHVVEGLQENVSNVNFVVGDMFVAVPHADAVLLKWILHDWSDVDCIKILERCKEAIPCKDKGGKVIIIDMVVGSKFQNSKSSNAQFVFDMEMMSLTGEGKERTKEEWGKLFIQAGFDDFNIFPILGLRSVIEVFPS